MNLFYKLWVDAENQRNSYNIIDVHWSEVPDFVTKVETGNYCKHLRGTVQAEFECEFLGSSNTLIASAKIKSMAFHDPIQSNAGLDMYEKPKEGATYVIVADVARGTQNDYSMFVVFDVSTVPYRIVAKYRNNEIKPLLFPNIIHDVAKAYNMTYVMVEVNDIGEQDLRLHSSTWSTRT